MICSHRAFAVALLISAGLLCQNTSAKTSAQKSTGKHYLLASNKDTVQWGWYDPTEKPRLVVDSGGPYRSKPGSTSWTRSSRELPSTKSSSCVSLMTEGDRVPSPGPFM